jgi:hypothetical protein
MSFDDMLATLREQDHRHDAVNDNLQVAMIQQRRKLGGRDGRDRSSVVSRKPRPKPKPG